MEVNKLILNLSEGFQKRVQDKADELQKQLHYHVDEIKERNPNIEYQDIATTFFLLKIAELHELLKLKTDSQ